MIEIKKGYKQTELGVIPEDWEDRPIGDFFDFKNGLNKSKEFFGYGKPIINYMDVYKNRALYLKNIYGLVNVNQQEIKSFKVKKGDVFFTRTSETVEEIGTSSVLLDDLNNCVFSGFILRARPKNNDLEDEYKKYCFSSLQVRKQIQDKCTYTTRALTNGRVLSKVKIFYPPKSEQTAIAAVLSDTDELITSLERLIAKKKAVKQGAMQELLTGKKRLPGFSGKWEVRKLGEVGNCIRGVSYNGERDLSSNDTVSTVRLLRSNNVQEGKINFNELQFVDYSRVKPIQVLQKNDIVICMANGSKQLVGKSAIFNFSSSYKYTFGAFMGCFRTKTTQAVSRFISFTLKTYQYRTYIDVLLSGSSINNLKPSDIESIKIPYPTKVEQTAIANILSDMDAEIEMLEHERDKYKLIKQGMMQELLTGRIRLV